MPTAFKSLFKQFKVTSDAGAFSEEIVVTDDYFTFPAEKEVFGTNTFANATVESSLFQFDIFKTVANRIKQVKDNASAWWERSAGANYVADFGTVQSDGTSAGDVANDNQGISPVGVI